MRGRHASEELDGIITVVRMSQIQLFKNQPVTWSNEDWVRGSCWGTDSFLFGWKQMSRFCSACKMPIDDPLISVCAESTLDGFVWTSHLA